jgi:Asp-tRNA(Asn)/Glu-tRNA(Gln) amidotransferase A subunit family amidase
MPMPTADSLAGEPGPSRRRFLATAAAAAVCAAAPSAAQQPEPTPVSTPPPPTSARGGDGDALAAAERLLAVEYSAAERAQLLESIEGHLELVRARRGFQPPNELAPATVFQPLLPGRLLPAGPDRVEPTAPEPPLPGHDEDIAYAPVAHLGHWLRTRQLTSTRLAGIYLERLERLGPRLECIATLTRELALRQAAAADAEISAGRWRGPLHGVPWGAKDLLDTAGIPTTWGAEPYRDRVPAADAAVVQRLEAAGAVLVAKLSLGALAYGDIWDRGRTNNPWHLREGSSGSSAGSAAATAAGLVGFAIGTETLGSIVSPSMRCGTTGLRPTFGRVARTGAMALCWSLDKIGPIGRTVEDTLLVLAAVHGADEGDPASVGVPLVFDAARPVRGLRCGYVPGLFEGDRAREPDRAALEAARRLGLEMVEVALPELPYGALLLTLFAEAAAAFEELTLSGRDDELKWQHKDAWPSSFRLARLISAVDLVQADRLRRRVMQALAEVFERVDVVLGPSYGRPWLLATNFTGHPSLTLRAGFVDSPVRSDWQGVEVPEGTANVPHGVTLWGRLYDEGTLGSVGMALERELDVWHRRPAIDEG